MAVVALEGDDAKWLQATTVTLGLACAQALVFAKEAVAGYEECTSASREAALDATRQASDFSQLAHKLMRAVYKAK